MRKHATCRGIFVLVGFLVLLWNGAPGIFYVIYLIFTGFVMLICIANTTPKEYLQRYKTQVIAPIVRELLENGKYFPERGVSEDVFTASRLYPKPDRYNSEDAIGGMVGKTEIYFAEAYAEEREKRVDANGKTTINWNTLFKGILFVADFNKYFKGQTIVTEHLWCQRDNRIILENIAFTARFNTFTTDDIEARYILSPNLMERILILDKKLGGKSMRLSFIHSLMIIAIPDFVNHFETHIWEKVDGPILKREFELLCAIIDIVDDLNLNTRIWTKQ